jgi:hypothetical protein
MIVATAAGAGDTAQTSQAAGGGGQWRNKTMVVGRRKVHGGRVARARPVAP